MQQQQVQQAATLGFLGWRLFARGFIRGVTAPVFATRSVYAFFAHGVRYTVVDLFAIGFSMFFTGKLVVLELFSHHGVADKVFYPMGYGLLLALVNTIAGWIKTIPASSPLRFLGWVPFMKWTPSRAQTWADPQEPASDKKFVRGSRVVDARGAGQQAQAAGADRSLNIAFGGVPFDPRNEAEHFLISGKTGAGETQAINAMLRTVRARRQPAIVADPAGGYLQRFGEEGEFILNPFDARDAGWSPFLELSADYDCSRLAKAAIPDGNGDSKEWHFYAQSLFGEVLQAQWKAGNHSLKELLRLVMAATSAELAKVLTNTAASILTQKGNEKMLSNTRAIASTYLAVWKYLPDQGQFSVRRWVQEVGSGQHDRWIYLSYQESQKNMLKNLVATWLEVAIVEGLCLTEEPSRRVWYILDEMDSLGMVSSLRDGLTKLRKFGGVIVGGLQTIAQLQDTYGRELSQTLLSCLSNKLVLAAGDADTAEAMSKELGDQEFERQKVSSGTSSQAMQIGGGRSSQTSTEHRIERAVLGSELTNLPNLSGYLKAVGQDIARIQLPYVRMADRNDAFVAVGA